jgi:hypothetical protein
MIRLRRPATAGNTAREAQPRLLDGVGLAQRAERPLGHGAQPGSVLLALLRQNSLSSTSHIPPSGVIRPDPRIRAISPKEKHDDVHAPAAG